MANKAKKATIYISPQASALIGPCASLTSRVDAIMRRYGCMVRDLAPEFSLAEWCAICEANNGTDIAEVPRAMVWKNFADSRGIGHRWGIDDGVVLGRLMAMTDAELAAIEEICVQFWQRCDEDPRAVLIDIGARIIEEKP